MIMGTKDNPFLHSFSHGGVNYYLRWDFEDLLAWVESAESDHVEEKFAEYGLLCTSEGMTPIQEDKYKEAVFEKLGVSKASIRSVLTQVKKELKPKLQENVEKEEQKLDFGSVYDTSEGDSSGMLPENASHGDILNDLVAVLPKHYVFGSVLYVWSGRDIWVPWSLSALQKEIAARYNHVGRCKRVSDYRAIAGAVLSSDELRKEAWRETPGFPVEDGLYAINREGFKDVDPESGFKFIQKREYHYEDYCRYKLMFKPDFSFDVETSNFKRILDNVDNPILLQQLCGLAVSGLLPLTQMAATFYGDGGSGKGVMFNILESLFPKERVTSISLEQMNDQKYRIELADARLNLVSEVQAVTRPDLTGFKEVVGGNLITGRALYLPPVAFTPCVGMILSMNKLFRLGEVGTAVERRFGNSIVKFVKRNTEQIEGLDRMIIENELPGILAWCMTGVELWADVGLDTTLSNQLWHQWKESEDITTLFFSECVMEGGRGVSRKDLWDAFREYCKNAGVSPLRKGDFYDTASKVLGPSTKYCGVQTWRTYSLNTGIASRNIYEENQ
jgi:P4 family phage/plasmid primase-like protien